MGEAPQQDDSQQATDYERWWETPGEPSAEQLQADREREIDNEVELEEKLFCGQQKIMYLKMNLLSQLPPHLPHRTHGYSMSQASFVPGQKMEKSGETHQMRK